MWVSIFEVQPAFDQEGKYIYTIDTEEGDILPFSATTLRRVDIPPNASFHPIRGNLVTKDGLTITLKKGYPYIVSTPNGPSIAWWIDGKFSIPDQILDKIPLGIPKKLIVSSSGLSLEKVPIKYPETVSSRVSINSQSTFIPQVSLQSPVPQVSLQPQPSVPQVSLQPQPSVPQVSLQPPVSLQAQAPVPQTIIDPLQIKKELPPVQQPGIGVPQIQHQVPEPVREPIVPKSQSLDSISSPSGQVSSMDLSDRLTFLEKVVENFLRREYKIYNGMSCPDRYFVDGQSVPLTPFDEIQSLMAKGEIVRFDQNPMLQPFAGSQRTFNRLLTFVDKKGTTYLTKASYDSSKNNLGPPA